MAMATMNMTVDECLDLPPGFRFHPTDEEIITHYLSPKVADHGFVATAIGDVDLNKCEPWDLPSKAKMGEKEWYFFCQRDRKYPTGVRTNRATEAGYWKATGKDREIYAKGGRRTALVGMKKTLVFYRGRAPRGDKSNWVMHEYRLQSKSTSPTPKDEWVVCRVFDKSNGGAKKVDPTPGTDQYAALPPLMDYSRPPGPGDYYYNNHEDVDNNNNFEAANSSSSYFSSLMAVMADDDFSNVNNPSAVAPPFGFQDPYSGAVESGYLHQDYYQTPAPRQCKVEQFTNNNNSSHHHHHQSMGLSEDTGVSTDRNTEISSVVSRHDVFDDLISGAEPGLDLDCMWKC